MRDCLTTNDGSLKFECEGHIFILEKLVPAEDVASPILYYLSMCLEDTKVL